MKDLEKEKEEVNTQKLENMMKALELYETAKEGSWILNMHCNNWKR